MKHIPLPILRSGLRVGFKLPAQLPIPLQWLRHLLDLGALVFPVRRDVMISSALLGGVNTERLTPSQCNERILIHFHGGAFFAGSARSHRGFTAELAARSGAVVFNVNYRRAPENPYPAALQDALAVYTALISQGFLAKNIVISGDSGGAAIAIALMLHLREHALAMPNAVLLISPFLDLSLSLPAVSANANNDPMLSARILKRGADAYRGKNDVHNPFISPIYADLTELPRILIQAGCDEILFDDARIFAKRALQAGVVTYTSFYPKVWHNFQMFYPWLKQANIAIDELAKFIRLGRI